MKKEINIRVCDKQDKPIILTYLINENQEDLFIESLSQDFVERGLYIDDVFC